MYLFSNGGVAQFIRNSTPFLLTKILNKILIKNLKIMCEPKNFGSVNCDAAKQWVEDFQKLSKNIPSGVSLVAVCSSAINKDQGMSISQVFGKKKDIIEMLVRLLDSNDAIHELFFDY